MATNRTIDTEHGDGPNMTMTIGDGGSYSVVFDEDDDMDPVKIYRDGTLRWEGDEQDLYMNILYELDDDSMWGRLADD